MSVRASSADRRGPAIPRNTRVGSHSIAASESLPVISLPRGRATREPGEMRLLGLTNHAQHNYTVHVHVRLFANTNMAGDVTSARAAARAERAC